MKLRRRVTLAAAALTVASLAGLDPAALPVPAEDDPGWQCTTMGNRVCGPDR